MEHEPKPFDPNSVKNEIDPSLPENNPAMARAKVKEELENSGITEEYIFPDELPREDDLAA